MPITSAPSRSRPLVPPARSFSIGQQRPHDRSHERITMPAETKHSQPASGKLFIRNATGLVREVRPLSSLVINYIVGSPVQVLGAGLFFALSLYPGGNFFLGLLIIVPMMLACFYTFGVMPAAIPRSR